MNQEYKNQVRLLLSVLPEVAKEKCFALHGGTAINLFYRNMPRLSVDIDLTYLPIEERGTTKNNIILALTRIKRSIEKSLPGISVILKTDSAKLLIERIDASVKVEVNLVARGVIEPTVMMKLCNDAQTEYDTFCEIQVVPLGQLYGGKICAALDRQHPRDLFDIKYLLANEGISEDIKKGFIYCLLGSERPMNEILNPHLLDQKLAMENQFKGMSNEAFDYEEYVQLKEKLINSVMTSITSDDKKFLLLFKNLTPNWDQYKFEEFPSIKWKFKNLKMLKEANPDKHSRLFNLLETTLS